MEEGASAADCQGRVKVGPERSRHRLEKEGQGVAVAHVHLGGGVGNVGRIGEASDADIQPAGSS
jgi:hypothetical protein